MCNWHRVDDSLPPLLPIGTSEELLLMRTNGRLVLGIYNSVDSQWKSYGNTLDDVKYWAIVELPVQTGV